MNDYIKLKKRDTLKIYIQDENGIPKIDENGHEIFIEFDLEDINLLDKYNKCVILIKKATNTLKNEMIIIDKKQDFKGKGLMTKNQELRYQSFQKFYKSAEEAMDLFLGKNGTNKIFGESRYITMFDDLSEMLEPIMPKLKINMESIEKKIKSKYSTQNGNALKDE